MSKTVAVPIIVLLLSSAVAPAQNSNGRIIGVITDPAGAVVPGARIKVTNIATDESRYTESGQDGAYQVLDVPVGTYKITVRHPNFSEGATSARDLLISQNLRVDVQLALGRVTETVLVQADAANVETINSTIAASITGQAIRELPLNGREALNLALTVPGVLETNPDSAAAGTFSVGGGRSDSVTFLLDGALNNNLLDNSIVYDPNPDTIAEFRVLQNNYTAEYGRNAGGVISLVTKSGANEFHGSLFDFVRNGALDANTFFNNERGLPTPTLNRQQFGATLGGHIAIPKYFRGRDKLFFFAGYQGQRQSATEINPTVTVFTPAELRGDFSHAVNGGPDPLVSGFLLRYPYFQPDPKLAAHGIIEPSKIDPIAQNYIRAGLIPSSTSGTLLPEARSTDNRSEATVKIDYVISTKDRLAATLGRNGGSQLAPFSASSDVVGYPDVNRNDRGFANVGYTRSFSPMVLNEARLTAHRTDTLLGEPAKRLPTAARLGIDISPDNPTGPPLLLFNSGMDTGFYYQGPTRFVDNSYIWADTFSWIRGRHSWKFGGDLFDYQNNTVYNYFVNGYFQFSGTSGGIGSGNDRADFLFGLPDYYTQFGQAPSSIRTRHFDGFAQDEWHLRRNLTVTMGVRYEYSTPKKDLQGRTFSFIPGLQSQRFPNAPIGLVFPGDVGAPRGANFPDRKDWAPRIGVAWDVFGDGRTSLRTGFGVFYDILKGEDSLQFNGQAPFFSLANLFFNPLSANSIVPPNYMSEPFAAAGVPDPFPSKPPVQGINFAAAGFLPFGGGSVFVIDPHLSTPYVYNYSLSLQQKLAHDFVADLTYVGNSAHGLTALVDQNPMILGSAARLVNAQYGLTPSDGYSYIMSFENAAKANFSALEANVTKQFSGSPLLGRTFFSFAYTWSHNIDNASGFRERSDQVPYYDHDAFRASSDQDVRQRLSLSGGWDLPFDQWWIGGPRYLTHGWSLHPILSWRTGFPLDLYAGYIASPTNPGPSGAGDANLVRPNLVGASVQILNPSQTETINGVTGNYWFSPNDFVVPNWKNSAGPNAVPSAAQRTYGSLPRNALRGPDRTNLDFALTKAFDFGERFKVEFRVEAFNVFNHTQFANPGCATGVSGVPQCNKLVYTSGTLGQITGTYDQRVLQLALRLRL